MLHSIAPLRLPIGCWMMALIRRLFKLALQTGVLLSSAEDVNDTATDALTGKC